MSNNRYIKILLKNKIPNIINWSSHVITGSPYLTNFSLKYNSNVTEIPTSVSETLYSLPQRKLQNEIFNIGWVGSKTTSINIIPILPAIAELSKKINVKLLLIGFNPQLENELLGINYQIINWSSDDEINQIKKFDVGIMPLIDTPFNNGKCGFKLVQYMACGLPTISTPLAANKKINRNGLNLHAETIDEWVAAFENVYNNKAYFYSVGLKNYNNFFNYYNTEKNINVYISLYKKLLD
jgi:glycosyltransferase involved in cell wall biosynthesis